MPITVLDNARGFEEGLQYANNVYNRIQDFAKHKQEQKSILARHRSQIAAQQYRDSMGLIEAGATSQDPGQREATRQFVNQLNTAMYNQPANMQGMYNKNYTDAGVTDYPEEMANNDMTPGMNQWKAMTTPIEPPSIPSVPNNGTPFLNPPAYEPPLQPARTGNIFDQIANPDTTPLMQRDKGSA